MLVCYISIMNNESNYHIKTKVKTQFSNMNIWHDSINLTKRIYDLINFLPSEENYNMIQQLRRASSSVSANIAEGAGRYYFKDKVRFYYQARGSLCEVQSFLFLIIELGYSKEES